MKKLRVAILGANGFIGSRITEVFYLNGLAEIRPIVRKFSSLARPSRFNMDWRIADANDKRALCEAFKDCDVVVDCVLGDTRVIKGTVDPIYYAAREAGVGRIVYLSSASVLGQNPKQGVDDDSLLDKHQKIGYNNAKVWAERRFLELSKKGAVKCVAIRPALVYGPCSGRWTIGLAEDLLNGRAYLINDGEGICNCVYIDNLVHAIYLSATKSGIDGNAFLISDKEKVTWLEFYRVLAEALGVDVDMIPRVSPPPFNISWEEKLDSLRSSDAVQAILPFFPKRLKVAARAALKTAFYAWNHPYPPSEWKLSEPVNCNITEEITLLQQCAYKFPNNKAEKLLDYSPIVTFDEACRRTISWLAAADYPIISRES